MLWPDTPKLPPQKLPSYDDIFIKYMHLVASGEIDVNTAQQRIIEERKANSRPCPKCGAKGEMYTPDLDWCPSCKYTWSGK